MTDSFSSNNPSQNTENIQKLFDFMSRVDERLKLVNNNQEQFLRKIENSSDKQIELFRKLAVLESHQSDVSKINESIRDMEKRLSKIEIDHGNHSERWKTVANFIIQLIWVILAAYLLTKLNLQSPAVP